MSHPVSSRLVLGTAQLGFDYGVLNAAGQPDAATAAELLDTAWSLGVRSFDTAAGYGTSEAVLGEWIASRGHGAARVTSKLPGDVDLRSADAVLAAVRGSLERLRLERLDCLLVHREEALDAWTEETARALAAAVEEGLCARIGVSVYTPEKALQALDLPQVGAVQVPSNALDRRFERAGVFERTDARVQVRSVFLQGVLLASGDCPVPGSAPIVEAYRSLARELGLTPLELALGYARLAYPEAAVLFGAETPAQVRANVETWARPCPAEVVSAVRSRFADVPLSVLDPRTWPARKP